MEERLSLEVSRMLDVLIEVRGTWVRHQQALLMRSLGMVVSTALGFHPSAALVRIHHLDQEEFLAPDGAGDRFIRVEASLLSTTKLEARIAVRQAITECLMRFDVPFKDMRIVVRTDCEGVFA